VQASNLCFAAGQIAWVRIRPKIRGVSDAGLHAWMLAGAAGVTLVFSLLTTDWGRFHPEPSQWIWLVYLGAVASGAGFFLWNRGALRVNTGTLAVFNNAKIPAAVLCSLLFFTTHTVSPDAVLRLAVSITLVLLALTIARRSLM
jgi:drug/metabolite transporter (DMT)-like permease